MSIKVGTGDFEIEGMKLPQFDKGKNTQLSNI